MKIYNPIDTKLKSDEFINLSLPRRKAGSARILSLESGESIRLVHGHLFGVEIIGTAQYKGKEPKIACPLRHKTLFK